MERDDRAELVAMRHTGKIRSCRSSGLYGRLPRAKPWREHQTSRTSENVDLSERFERDVVQGFAFEIHHFKRELRGIGNAIRPGRPR